MSPASAKLIARHESVPIVNEDRCCPSAPVLERDPAVLYRSSKCRSAARGGMGAMARDRLFWSLAIMGVAGDLVVVESRLEEKEVAESSEFTPSTSDGTTELLVDVVQRHAANPSLVFVFLSSTRAGKPSMLRIQGGELVRQEVDEVLDWPPGWRVQCGSFPHGFRFQPGRLAYEDVGIEWPGWEAYGRASPTR